MFELSNHQAKIANFTPRAEKHGDENVPAGSVRIEVTAHSSILDTLDPGLRTFLFRKPGVGEQPSLIEGDNLTSLARPSLKPLKLDEDFPGYTLEINTGLDMSEPLRLVDVELSSFSIEAMNGGSVTVAFSAACHPDADESGALCQLIQNVVDVTLVPPKAGEEQKPQSLAA